MRLFDLFKKKNPKSQNTNLFSGGDGSTEQSAVIIKATNTLDGISAEYEFAELKYGKQGTDWELEKQMKYDNNSRQYDILEIKFSDGSRKKIYFDITNFFGNF